MFQVRLPCYLGLNSGRSVSIKVNHFSETFMVHMSPQYFPVSHTGSIASSVSFLFSRCKLCLRYTAGNFNENPSMRALAKVLRARASEHSSNFVRAIRAKVKFCEHFQIGWDHSIPLHVMADEVTLRTQERGKTACGRLGKQTFARKTRLTIG